MTRGDASQCADAAGFTLLSQDSYEPSAAELEIAQSLREVMASVCTPVSVVTALDDGRPHGTTVSAFCSLSLKPPMIVVCLDRRSALLEIIRATGCFGLNVLGSEDARSALAFSMKGERKFDGFQWSLDRELPRLSAAAGWVACNGALLVDGGDHVVVLGSVVSAECAPTLPLTYYQREFGTHRSLPGRTDAV
jgi:flavin reductase (DIM6/NTAB) family NADH-FMN oxidoreductase RutF